MTQPASSDSVTNYWLLLKLFGVLSSIYDRRMHTCGQGNSMALRVVQVNIISYASWSG